MDNIPIEFLCPISLDIMKDPLIMPDGQTYDRDSIYTALKHSPFSPITKQRLNFKDAVPNYAIKSMIEKFLNHGKIENSQNIDRNKVTLLNDDKNSFKLENSQKVDINAKTHIESFKAEVIDDPSDNKKVFVNLTIQPKRVISRKPLLLISMIDVSSSMQLSASEDMKGEEKVSFSRLELVRHALKTIVSTLNFNDKMALITFNGVAKLALKSTNVKKGKNIIFNEINKMTPYGFTNIWDALKLGLIEAKKYRNYNICLMLFTDGEPNINPPKGIISSLREYISNINDINFTISTFAFGYQVNSKLMEEISKIGNGIYGYCPDCTMVGTIFINFISNILSTIESGIKIDVNNKNFKKKFEIGGLYSGISRHLSFSMNKSDFKNTEITLFLGKEEKNKIQNIDYTEKNSEIMNQYYRYKLIELIENNLETEDHNKILKDIKSLFNRISTERNKTEFMKSLLIDLIHDNLNHGQVEKAFSSEFFKKWGLNYLLSFLRFHIMEQCGNFKDQSLKYYASEDFEKLRTKCNKIFINLPPPKNDIGEKEVKKEEFETICYNPCGGCFNGDALVELKNGQKKVKNLRKGDILKNGAIVECLVENKINREEKVVSINDVLFSLYHPIEINGEWIFPCQHFKVVKKYISSWYNLVLKNKHEVVLNGVKAITLGHNRTEGILKHPYFGTEKVINALKKYNTYNSGFISTSNLKAHRTNNLIDQYY